MMSTKVLLFSAALLLILILGPGGAAKIEDKTIASLSQSRSWTNPFSSIVDKARFYIQGTDFTINLIPFFILLKVAFILGKNLYFFGELNARNF